MADALYGSKGFYTSGGSAGRRGDFITSPEIGPLFGAVVGRFLDFEWNASGQPAEFNFYEVGAGPGTLARSVTTADLECADALRYHAIEISDEQRALHPSGITSLKELPNGELTGVVFANELLDNLPFRLAVFDGGWREAFVVSSSSGAQEVLSSPFDPCPPVLPASAVHGARAPLVDAASAWVQDVLSRLNGVLVALDYFTPTTFGLAERPWREWLRTYRAHERGGHYLMTPGAQDITTEVPIDQLPEPSVVRSQAQWLELHGLSELVEEGRRVWEERAARPDVQALKMRSRISEAEALRDPDGLGGFLVLEWR
jgi:SAM-dependent MidA family methyltransferase